jgi:hypothetical protein
MTHVYARKAGIRGQTWLFGGDDKSKGWIADDFNAPLPDDTLAGFEGRD